MVKNLLKSGKIIYPKKLILKNKLNIGIVGSGTIANEYARIISSFGHKLTVIISKSKNRNAKNIAKKYNAKIFSNISKIDKNLMVHAWIVCTSWNKLGYYLKFFFTSQSPILIEKGVALNSKKIFELFLKNKKKSKISVAYNRNYYDYIFYLLKILNNNKLKYCELNIYDSYKDIISKHGKSIRKFITYYITSHWISLLLKIFQVSKYEIINTQKQKLNSVEKNHIEKIQLTLRKNKEKCIANIINFPNGVRNHSLKLYFKNFMIELSPFEKLKVYKKIKKKKNKKMNIYIPQVRSLGVDNSFKPGFRLMYYDFIRKNFFNKDLNLSTNISQLYNIYKVCEKFN